MRLTFLGTRGGIIARSPLHFMHSVLLIQFRKTSLLIDWGADWLGKSPPIANGLLITHAHPDHAGGLAQGFEAPVYASAQTWHIINKYPLEERHVITPGEPFTIGSIHIEAFEVYHSLRAPALGYRITAGKKILFYVPDLVALKDQKEALANLDLYVGDGALITRKLLIRKKNGTNTGHSPIHDQIVWCKSEGVPRALFTHCGSEIVKSDPAVVRKKMTQLGHVSDIKVNVAFDGMHFKL